MTTRIEAKNTLLKEFIDNYSLGYQVAYTNNEDFEKPTDEPWIRFMIQNNFSDQVSYSSVGNRKFGRYGLISYQVFIPANTGTYDGDVICEHINNIFEGKRFGIIYCEEGSWSEVGVTDGDLFQFNGTISFNLDEVK